MKIACPNCCPLPHLQSEKRSFRRSGKFWRKSDGRWISRFLCLLCKRGFSRASNHPCLNQKKRHKNQIVKKLLCGNVSQREAARITGLNRKTIVRKLLYWARVAELELEKMNEAHGLYHEVEFDDLETFEHTKCKPVSITLMVEYKTRKILGFEVSRMPANGPLAAISRKKYGPRRDERPEARKRLFSRVKKYVLENAIIRSDSNPHYPKDVKENFPKASHHTIKGKRGCITGQGELKKTYYDPLFSLNHTCAMYRGCVSRLIRRTWCTTKTISRLRAHLLIYSYQHNQRLLAKELRQISKK